MKLLVDNHLRLRPINLPDDIELALPWHSDWERVRVKEVYAHNHRAHALFRSLGFQVLRQGGRQSGEGSWAYELLLKGGTS